MILLTGAGGKTGQALLRSLARRDQPVRAWVRRREQEPAASIAGAEETLAGDLLDASVARRAMVGIRAIYHICPNVHPREEEIGLGLISAAVEAGVERFCFHSVLYPELEAMPHHWRKHLVEKALRSSGLAFTILQPTAYLQNLLAHREVMLQEGLLPVPYDLRSRVSLVDLEEVAEAAATVLVGDEHGGAVYPLCSADAPSQEEVAAGVEKILGRPVRAVEISRVEWRRRALASGLGEERSATLLAMFRHYDRHGMVGEPGPLGSLLGRSPRGLEDFLQHAFRDVSK